MISAAVRVAASRGAARAAAASKSASASRVLTAWRTQTPMVLTATTTSIRHFSSPPAFLEVGEVTDRIVSVVRNFDQVDPSKVTPETKFADDLGLDSLDIVEVVMAIEDEFAIEIPDQEADKISSIAEAIDYITTHPMAK